MSLQAVTGMGDFVVRETAQKGPDACVSWRPVLQALLHKLLQMLLYLDFDPVLLEVSSETLFTLVCADYVNKIKTIKSIFKKNFFSFPPLSFQSSNRTFTMSSSCSRRHRTRCALASPAPLTRCSRPTRSSPSSIASTRGVSPPISSVS